MKRNNHQFYFFYSADFYMRGAAGRGRGEPVLMSVLGREAACRGSTYGCSVLPLIWPALFIGCGVFLSAAGSCVAGGRAEGRTGGEFWIRPTAAG